MNDTWWKFAVLGLVIVGLLVWRRGQQEQPVTDDALAEQQIEQQVNQLLEQNNITLPEGSERVNLKAREGVVATGVVSLSEDDDETMVAVIASLPETDSSYGAWMLGEGVEPMMLGTLRLAKGGYLLDYTTSEDLSVYDQVIVDEGSIPSDAPLLSGELPEETDTLE